MTQATIFCSFITQDQEYQLFQAKDAEAAAERAELNTEIAYAESNTLTQVNQLLSQINLAAEQRPSAIIVEPVSGEAYERVARQALQAGIGWVLLNAQPPYLEDLRREFPKLPIASVMTNQGEVGRIQAAQFRALLPEGGTMLYVQGPFATETATERIESMQKGIKDARIRVHTAISDWTERGAEQSVAELLSLKGSHAFELDLVGCQNDSQAVGARRALERHRPEWARLPFTGCDGISSGGQEMVRNGRLAATIITPSNAGPAVNLIAEFLFNGQLPPPSLTLAPRSFPDVSML